MASHVPPRVNAATFGHEGRRIVAALVALLVLTSVSWGLAHVPLGRASLPVALGIAALKASIVGVVFMELSQASTTERTIGLITLFYIALLCFGTIADSLLR